MNEWQKAALAVIGIIDYDIEKEQESLFEEGETGMVDEVAAYLKHRFSFKGDIE